MSALDVSALRDRVLSQGGSRVAELDRRPLPHRVILRALPRAIATRFDPSAAGELEALFELRVRDPGGGEPARFWLSVAGGRCQVSAGAAGGGGAAGGAGGAGAIDAAGTAGASVTVGAGDLIRLVSRAAGWPALLSGGRLELAGDPFLALRFPILFRLPAAGSE